MTRRNFIGPTSAVGAGSILMAGSKLNAEVAPKNSKTPKDV